MEHCKRRSNAGAGWEENTEQVRAMAVRRGSRSYVQRHLLLPSPAAAGRRSRRLWRSSRNLGCWGGRFPLRYSGRFTPRGPSPSISPQGISRIHSPASVSCPRSVCPAMTTVNGRRRIVWRWERRTVERKAGEGVTAREAGYRGCRSAPTVFRRPSCGRFSKKQRNGGPASSLQRF